MAFKLNLGTLGLTLSLQDGQFKASMSGAQRMIGSFAKMAAKAAAYGVDALSAGLLYSVHSLAKFEQAIMNAVAVSGEGMKAFGQFKAAAMDAAAGSMFSATEAGNALEFLSLAGFSVGSSIAALPGVLQLATAAQIGLGEATDIATDTLTGFRLQASDLTRVNDVLVKTFTSSNTNLAQLGEAMKYVAPVAAGLGVDIETAAAALGLLADAGIKASMAGTGFSGVLAKLKAPTPKAAGALKDLGVSFFDVSGSARDAVDVFEDLSKSLDGLSDQDVARAMDSIFGKQYGKSAEVLIDAAGRAEKSMRSYRKELRKSGGASREVAQLMERTISGSMKILKGNVENAAITFGQFFGPAVYSAANMLTEFVKESTSTEKGFNRMRSAAVLTLNTIADLLEGGASFTEVFGHIAGATLEAVNGLDAYVKSAKHAVAVHEFIQERFHGTTKSQMSAYIKMFNTGQELDAAMGKIGASYSKATDGANAAAKGIRMLADAARDGARGAAEMTRETVELLATLDKLDKKDTTKKKKRASSPKKTSPKDVAVDSMMEMIRFSADMAGKAQKEHADAMRATNKAIRVELIDMLDAYTDGYKKRKKLEDEALKLAEKAAKERLKAEEAHAKAYTDAQDTTTEIAEHFADKALGVITSIFGPGLEEFVGAVDSAFAIGKEVFEQTGSHAAAVAATLADGALSLVGALAATDEFQAGMDAVNHAFERLIGKVDPLGWIASHLEGAFGAFIVAFEEIAEMFPEMGGLSNDLARGFFEAARGLIWMITGVGEVLNRISQGFNWLLGAVMQIPKFLADAVNGILDFLGFDKINTSGIDGVLAGFEDASARAAETADKLGQIRDSIGEMTYTEATTAFNDEVTAMAENMSDLNDELRNAPSGFKTRLASMRYGVDGGEVAAGTGGGGGSTTVNINALGMQASELVAAMERRSILRSGSSTVTESSRYSTEYAARRFA